MFTRFATSPATGCATCKMSIVMCYPSRRTVPISLFHRNTQCRFNYSHPCFTNTMCTQIRRILGMASRIALTMSWIVSFAAPARSMRSVLQFMLPYIVHSIVHRGDHGRRRHPTMPQELSRLLGRTPWRPGDNAPFSPPDCRWIVPSGRGDIQ